MRAFATVIKVVVSIILLGGCGSSQTNPTCFLSWRGEESERPCYVELSRTRDSGALYVGFNNAFSIRVFFFERPEVGSTIPIYGAGDNAEVLVEDSDGICTSARADTDEPPYSEIRFVSESESDATTVEIDAYVQCPGGGWRLIELTAVVTFNEEG